MQTLVINVDNDININDIFAQLKKLYPSAKVSTQSTSAAKKFTGTSDLKRIKVDDFRMYEREELYDR